MKKNKIAKKISLLIIAALVIAAGAATVFGASNNVTGTVDLNDLIRLTTSNNSELNLFEQKIKVKEKWYRDSLKDKDGESAYEEDIRKYVTPFRRDLEIKDLEWQRSRKQDEVVLNTTKMYYAILNKDAMIENQKKRIERLKKVLENKKKRIEAGIDAEYTIIEDEANLKEAEVILKQLQNEEQNLRMELNINIGNEVTQKLDFKKVEIPYNEYNLDDINKVISTKLEKSYTIKKLIEEQKIDIKEKDIVEDYVDDDASELEKLASIDYEARVEELEDELLTLKYDIEDEKKNIEAKIRTDYNNILNLQNEVLMKKLTYENANINLKAEEAKYKAGKSTQMNVDIAKENVDSALYEYNTAKLNYYIAVEEFKNYIESY